MRTFLLLLPALVLVPLFADEPAREEERVRAIQRLLDECLIDAKPFRNEQPLGEFLAALEKHLPADKKLSLRIDEKAFGDKAAAVSATPVALPASPKSTSLRQALELAVAKVKVGADYRIGIKEVAITTPQQALYSAAYDIRDFVEQRTRLSFSELALPDFRRADAARRAELIVQTLSSAGDLESIEILNGARLIVRTNASRHAGIAEMLRQLRRLSDMHVVMKAELHEVDQAYYSKLTDASKVRRSLEEYEELEREFTSDKPPKEAPLWKLLEKQSPILTGEVKMDDGTEAVLLGRHRVAHCLPSPEQVRRGETRKQTILEGISFRGSVQVTPDRRFVRIKLTEKAAELQRVEKLKLWDAADRQREAELPILDETLHSRPLLIPDGGSLLVAVQFRPKSLRAKDRWWVLRLTPRIVIAEEEEIIRRGSLESLLPAVVADVLNNPRLKATREFYGTPGDKRFALVNSDAWTWPKELRPAVPGHQPTAAVRMGNRLLGIRIDQIRGDDDFAITVTLVNAGGTANGEVIGGGTLRYLARTTDKGTRVELSPLP